MHINEAYDHDPILPYAGGDALNSCNKTGTQCVDVSAALTLVPSATVSTVQVACQGNPTITCVTAPDGASCTITFTQQICVSVPICYGVTVETSTPTIACADDSCIGCGCC